jgi:hypothetical protein
MNNNRQNRTKSFVIFYLYTLISLIYGNTEVERNYGDIIYSNIIRIII